MSQMKQTDPRDEYFMTRCLALASRGRGQVSPNPMVGAVLAREDGILGEGWHERFGAVHAEVSAVRSARGDVRGATLYVNLEPCAHWGKTPPCTDLLISAGIARLVAAMKDPNPAVAGRGFRKLRRAGVSVSVGVMEKEARALNEAYIHHTLTGLPFVALKVAQSLDGNIAASDGGSRWITSEESRRYVHELRASYDAVLVGAGTVRSDDPSLTVRLVEGRNPRRVVLDGDFKISPRAALLSDRLSDNTIVITSMRALERNRRKSALLEKRGVTLVGIRRGPKGRLPLDSVLAALSDLGVASLLVEGGSDVFSEFIVQRLVQKVYIFQAPLLLGDGIKWTQGIGIRSMKETVALNHADVRRIGDDILVEGYPKW